MGSAHDAREPCVVLHESVPAHVEAYRHLLEVAGVRTVVTSRAALAADVRDHAPALVIVDAAVSEPDPFQCINVLRGDRKTAHIPVLLVTRGFSDRRLRTHPGLAGGIETLSRPFDVEQFLALIQFFVQHWRYRCVIESLGQQQDTTLVENDKEGLLAIDDEGKICYANAAAERILKARATYLVGKYVESVLDDPAPSLVSQWQDHPVNRVTRGEQILQVDSTTLWRADGEPIRAKYAAIPLKDRAPIHLIFAFRELRESREDRARQSFIDYADSLTGLPLRARSSELLEKIRHKAARKSGFCAVLHVDMDHFSHINEGLGHAIGDRLLTQVAQRLKPLIRRQDCIGRLEGDEFVIGLSALDRIESAGLVARKIVEHLGEVYLVDGHEIHCSASVGIALFPHNGDSVETLLRNAQIAMQRAKQLGRNTHQYFADEMNRSLADRLQVEFELHKAFDLEQLQLSAGQIVDNRSGEVTGWRLGVVWQHPTRGDMPLAAFAPLAEDAGLGATLARWIWGHSLEWLSLARARGVIDEALPVFVPVSPVLVGQEDGREWMLSCLQSTGTAHHQLVLELPESSTLLREPGTLAILREWHGLGFRFLLDGFGSGFVPLQHLATMPLAFVRLSPALLAADGGRHHRLLTGVLQLLDGLGLRILAPDSTHPDQLADLAAGGCHWHVPALRGSVP
jgi:diguanylate cyclase (GGDEF)-like protein